MARFSSLQRQEFLSRLLTQGSLPHPTLAALDAVRSCV
jgi:hypothetical protein